MGEMKFDENFVVRLEFTPGTLMMKPEYVREMLCRGVMEAFHKAQAQYLQYRGNPWVNITVSLDPNDQ